MNNYLPLEIDEGFLIYRWNEETLREEEVPPNLFVTKESTGYKLEGLPTDWDVLVSDTYIKAKASLKEKALIKGMNPQVCWCDVKDNQEVHAARLILPWLRM